MGISATTTIGQSFDYMKRVLFEPFELRKWLVMGFAAFLASLGSGGNNFQLPDLGNEESGDELGPVVDEMGKHIGQWIQDNLQTILTVGLLVLVALVALGLLLAWLSARGKFIFLDNVVRNEAAIKQPWREYKQEGNRLFVFNIVLGFGSLLVLALLVGGGLWLAWQDIQSSTFGTGATLALAIGGLLVVPLVLLVLLVNSVMHLWGIPLMYMRRIGALEGLRAAFSEIVFPHLGSVILFWLLLIMLGIGAGVVGIIAILLTCCIGALPYVNSVLLLPISVFFRCLPLHFMEQIGPQYRIFRRAAGEDVVDVFR